MFYTIISGLNFLCPKYTRKIEGGQTFTSRTIAEWNAFDPTIRKKPSIASFKRTLYKKFLTDQKTSPIPPKSKLPPSCEMRIASRATRFL